MSPTPSTRLRLLSHGEDSLEDLVMKTFGSNDIYIKLILIFIILILIFVKLILIFLKLILILLILILLILIFLILILLILILISTSGSSDRT